MFFLPPPLPLVQEGLYAGHFLCSTNTSKQYKDIYGLAVGSAGHLFVCVHLHGVSRPLGRKFREILGVGIGEKREAPV